MSLIALAHADPVPPPVNSAFYATVATGIPVLYLALAIQRRFFEDLIKLYIRATRRVRSNRRLRESVLRVLAAVNAALAPLTIAILILYAGAIAEVLAIVALYEQHANMVSGAYILAGAIFLAVTVNFFHPAISGAWRTWMARRTAWRARGSSSGAAAAAGQIHPLWVTSVPRGLGIAWGHAVGSRIRSAHVWIHLRCRRRLP